MTDEIRALCEKVGEFTGLWKPSNCPPDLTTPEGHTRLKARLREMGYVCVLTYNQFGDKQIHATIWPLMGSLSCEALANSDELALLEAVAALADHRASTSKGEK